MADVLTERHICTKFSMDPYFNIRVVRCQDCYATHEGASKIAESAYQWGLSVGKKSKEVEIKRALGIHNL